ncbi:hypothetical protein HanIR_Chr14g0709301 [Helianthus annuus]|nr:hypothetical protein HanIR_Chr14g0709301 [Helianthus annuus]
MCNHIIYLYMGKDHFRTINIYRTRRTPNKQFFYLYIFMFRIILSFIMCIFMITYMLRVILSFFICKFIITHM